MEKKICPNCGAEGTPSDKFCRKCGSLLVNKSDKVFIDLSMYEKEKTNTEDEDNARINMGKKAQVVFSKLFSFIARMWEKELNGEEETTDRARYVSSARPLENRIKKIRSFYLIIFICICMGFVVKPFMGIGIVGFVLMYPIDICVTQYQIYHLRRLKFGANNEMTNEEIFERLRPIMLSKYGIAVTKNELGQVVIIMNNFVYTIIRNLDSTFCIYWSASFEKKNFFEISDMYYKSYKEMLEAMGKIAYELQTQFNIIQDIDKNQTAGTYSKQETEKMEEEQSQSVQSPFFLMQGKKIYIAIISIVAAAIVVFGVYQIKVKMFDQRCVELTTSNISNYIEIDGIAHWSFSKDIIGLYEGNGTVELTFYSLKDCKYENVALKLYLDFEDGIWNNKSVTVQLPPDGSLTKTVSIDTGSLLFPCDIDDWSISVEEVSGKAK